MDPAAKKLKYFAVGGVLLLFVSANVILFFVRSDPVGTNDGIRAAGFPLLIWEAGGFSYRQHFSWAALGADLLIAISCGALAAIVSRKVCK
jgi:hypothetical protein